MSKKKDLPLAVLKTLEPYVNLQGEKFKVIVNENLLHVNDIDDTSDFFFSIKDYKEQNNSFHFLLERKPKNHKDTSVIKNWINLNNLDKHFKSWVNLLNQYDEVVSFYDDPIIKSNAEQFYQKFEILDENSDFETFNLEQQLLLEEYLNTAKKNLLSLKENENEGKTLLIEELENEADEIKSVLTKESKKKVIRRLSKFLGKAQKTGLDVIKAIFINVSSEIIKGLLKGN